MTRSLPLAACAAALVLLAGCKTAERVYTDAMALETSGDVEAAARAYAAALRRDPALPNARGRLGVAGREAVARRIARAGAASTRSGAADEFLAAEALVRDAERVGGAVERPASFEADVQAACADAVEAIAEAGDARAEAGDPGTFVAAVFPAVQPRTPTGDVLPRDFLRDASDVLLDDRLAEPAPFRFIVDPAETRRALRQSRGDLSGSPRLLAELTRDLDADVGVVAEVDGFQFAETERRAVVFPLRAGEPAAGVRLTTEMTLRVRAALVATDASGRRIACDADAPEVTVSERYASATSETPVDKLRLSDDERDLFGSAARDRAYGRLVTGLRDRLADQLARRVAACLDAQVP